jgi:hypothetical protein
MLWRSVYHPAYSILMPPRRRLKTNIPIFSLRNLMKFAWKSIQGVIHWTGQLVTNAVKDSAWPKAGALISHTGIHCHEILQNISISINLN